MLRTACAAVLGALLVTGCDLLDSDRTPLQPADGVLPVIVEGLPDPNDYAREGMSILGVQGDTLRAPTEEAPAALVRVRGDSLVLDVQYSGGCAEHLFGLLIDSVFAESDPVQTRAWLLHDDRDDSCDGLLASRLSFDLAPLREAYTEGYRTDAGTIWIHLDESLTIQYEFGP